MKIGVSMTPSSFTRLTYLTMIMTVKWGVRFLKKSKIHLLLSLAILISEEISEHAVWIIAADLTRTIQMIINGISMIA